MTAGEGDDEQLLELDDDAIVAQQAPAHAPAPRAQVAEEARSIVVAPAPQQRGRNDPTMLVRTVRHPLPGWPPPTVEPPPPAVTPRWVAWLIWGIAGLLALVLGGALAIIAERRAATPSAPDPAPVETITR
jgi:hypothetical protein